MKNWMIAGLLLMGWQSQAQSIVGTWQLTDEKTCFQSEMKESETEKELLPQMSSESKNSVARLFIFDEKGKGKEGVFSAGKKKSDDLESFKYKVNGKELLLLDNKSGIMIRQLIIEEMSASTLKIHDAKKECEIKTFTRIK